MALPRHGTSALLRSAVRCCTAVLLSIRMPRHPVPHRRTRRMRPRQWSGVGCLFCCPRPRTRRFRARLCTALAVIRRTPKGAPECGTSLVYVQPGRVANSGVSRCTDAQHPPSRVPGRWPPCGRSCRENGRDGPPCRPIRRHASAAARRRPHAVRREAFVSQAAAGYSCGFASPRRRRSTSIVATPAMTRTGPGRAARSQAIHRSPGGREQHHRVVRVPTRVLRVTEGVVVHDTHIRDHARRRAGFTVAARVIVGAVEVRRVRLRPAERTEQLQVSVPP